MPHFMKYDVALCSLVISQTVLGNLCILSGILRLVAESAGSQPFLGSTRTNRKRRPSLPHKRDFVYPGINKCISNKKLPFHQFFGRLEDVPNIIRNNIKIRDPELLQTSSLVEYPSCWILVGLESEPIWPYLIDYFNMAGIQIWYDMKIYEHTWNDNILWHIFALQIWTFCCTTVRSMSSEMHQPGRSGRPIQHAESLGAGNLKACITSERGPPKRDLCR